MWQWELQVLGQELLDVWSLDVGGLLDLGDLQDVDGSKSSSVSSSHVLVQRLDSTDSGNVSDLLVHVVSTGSGVVSDPHAEVLDGGWVSLADAVDGDDFTRSLLDLVQSLQEVPVTGLGDDHVWSKDSHSEQLWFRNGFGGQTTADNLVFIQTSHCNSLVRCLTACYRERARSPRKGWETIIWLKPDAACSYERNALRYIQIFGAC